jgi:hypothetical protein
MCYHIGITQLTYLMWALVVKSCSYHNMRQFDNLLPAKIITLMNRKTLKWYKRPPKYRFTVCEINYG